MSTLYEVCNVMACSRTTDGVAVPITIYVPSQANNFIELQGQSLMWQGTVYATHTRSVDISAPYYMYISIYAFCVL